MKKLFTFLALVLGLVSCQTEPEGFDVNVGGEQDVNITVSLPESTRAGSEFGAFDNGVLDTYDLRYILEIYLEDDDDSNNGKWFRDVKYSNATTVSFPVRLAPGREYKFAVWADFVTKNNRAEDTDLFYETSAGLKNITIDVNKWTPNVEARDAFYGKATLTKGQSIANLPTIELTRPFAKVRVVATDIEDIRKFGIEPTNAVADYFTAEMYTSFNAVEGKAFGTTTTKTHTFNYADVDTYTDVTGQFTVFADYVFVPEDGNVQFSLDIKAGTERIKLNNFNTAIPVERNKVTSIVGDVLTEGGNVNITINGTLEEKETITLVDTAASLQEVIAGIEDGGSANIELGGDIDLGDLFGASILSTRAAATLPIVIAEGKTLVLDLNGFKITTPWEDEAAQKHYYAFENHGSLTIQDSKGNGQIIARGIFNYGTMTLESGIINACDGNGGYGVRNYEGAEFIMNGGSIVTSYEDGDTPGNGYDASPVRVDEGATATINGGAINNVSNFTVAIDNYGTTTINDGTFTTIHTTIANSATMTINGGSFTCNGLEGVTAHAFWAAAGAATINGGTFNGKDNYNGFNVCASKGATVNIKGGEFLPVHSGSLYGEGTIIVKGGEFFDNPSKYVAAGYEAVVENGVYTVAKSQALVAFEEAIAQGGEVTLDADITLSETVVIESGKTVVLNLNGKTITGNWHKDNGAIIKNNGTLTIVGGTISSTGDNGGSAVMNNGILTIENATLNGARNANGSWPSYSVNNTGIMTVENTTITSYHGAVASYGDDAVVTLNNCTIDMAGIAGFTSHGIYTYNNGKVVVNGGTYENKATDQAASGASVINGAVEVNAGTFTGRIENYYGTPVLKGGTFSVKPNANFVAEGYAVITKDNTYTVIPTVLKDGDELDLCGAEYNGTITVEGNVTIKGDTNIKTLKSTTGCTITIEDGKTLTLNNFSFGAKDNANAEYEIKGGTVTANYGFFQHGKYTLRSNFETGYMYYSFGSDITVYGTFHSQGKGDGLDYVRGKLTIAKGGKSIHDKSLWVGQPASWGAMNASLVIEEGGYVQANSLSVYEGSSLTYSNDADLKYNSVTGAEYITKK